MDKIQFPYIATPGIPGPIELCGGLIPPPKFCIRKLHHILGKYRAESEHCRFNVICLRQVFDSTLTVCPKTHHIHYNGVFVNHTDASYTIPIMPCTVHMQKGLYCVHGLENAHSKLNDVDFVMVFVFGRNTKPGFKRMCWCYLGSRAHRSHSSGNVHPLHRT